MRIEHGHKLLDEFARTPGYGQLRIVKEDGYLKSAGEEVVYKLNELDAETQEALTHLGKRFSSPKFEVVCVGPELVVDRVYVYKRKA